jgi:hypothetical protein
MQGSGAWFRSRSALALSTWAFVSCVALSACESDLADDSAATRERTLDDQAVAERSASLESTLSIAITQDTSIRVVAPNKNFGNAPELDVNRALLKLEPSELAAVLQPGDEVLSAQLELTLVGRVARRLSRPRQIGAHRVLTPWSESGATWLCAVDANPSNARPDCPSSAWSLLGGGSFVQSPSARSEIPASRSGVVTLDLTSDLRDMLAGAAPNHGWLLKTDSLALLEVADFASAESATPPRLVVKLRREDPNVVINEVESNGGTPGDWVELYNAGRGTADLSGYRFKDSDDTHTFYTLPAGTSLAPGAYLVLEEAQFGFGLGGADSARVFAPSGETPVAAYAWTTHAPLTYGRCPNATGDFQPNSSATKGAPNDCTPPVFDAGADAGSADAGFDGGSDAGADAGESLSIVLNEVESSGGTPGDWVELYNTGSSAVDLSGYRFKDNDDTHAFYTLPAGTSVAPGAYLLLEEAQFGFGLGSADSARLFGPSGDAPVLSYSWTAHAPVSYGRCPNGTGVFGPNTTSTKGATNDCSVPVDAGADAESDAGSPFAAWPGRNSVTTVDALDTFVGNLSGISYQPAGSAPAALWAVTNSPSRLYRLEYDGALWLPVSTDDWSQGKTLVYPAGTGGPDSEGVTKAEWDAPAVYVATERDNSANAVSRLAILRFDTSAVGSTLAATHEWNLTADLPAVGPNLGLEAITWIPDSHLVAAGFRDESRSSSYDPALYPDHGNGVFFVGIEATGMIYAYVLNHATGNFQRVAGFGSGLAGTMGLEFDRERSTLWSYCDDTCGNRSSLLSVSSAAASLGQFVVRAQLDRPGTLPNINNEGIAFAPDSECVAGFKSFFWSDDADTGGHSLRRDTIPCAPLF